MAQPHGRRLALALALTVAATAVSAQSPILLPGTGGDSFATGVVMTATGPLAVGYVAEAAGNVPFTWSYASGTLNSSAVGLADPFAGGQIMGAHGDTVVGFVNSADFATVQAVTWNTASPGTTMAALPVTLTDVLPVAQATNGTLHAGFVLSTADFTTTTAVAWDGAAAIPLDLGSLPLTGSTAATAVTADGQVAGWVTTDPDTGARHAILWALGTGQVNDLTPTGGEGAILGTDGTQLVGNGRLPAQSNLHAWLWDALTQTGAALPDVGYTSSEAAAIAEGLIVGWGTSAADGYTHALAWQQPFTQPLDLGTPTGYLAAQATAVNGDGWIVGWAADNAGTTAVLWQIPEPATLALLGAGALLLLRRRGSWIRS